jgi:hypothetical protein
VGHVGAHLDVNVDKSAVGHGNAGFVRCDLFAVQLQRAGCQP